MKKIVLFFIAIFIFALYFYFVFLPEHYYSKGNNALSTNMNKADAKSVVKYYTKAAKMGNVSAQEQLGVLYSGFGNIPEDSRKSIYWTTKAAQSGDVRAQMRLSEWYSYGTLLPKLELESIKWLKKAARNGNARAQLKLSRRYDEGFLGQDANKEKASYWLNKALASAKSSNDDSVLYEISREFEGKEAVEILEASALLGNYFAQISLVDAYIRGEGISKSIPIAWAWNNIANRDNGSLSPDLKKELEEITPEQLVQAKQLSHQYWNIIKTNLYQ